MKLPRRDRIPPGTAAAPPPVIKPTAWKPPPRADRVDNVAAAPVAEVEARQPAPAPAPPPAVELPAAQPVAGGRLDQKWQRILHGVAAAAWPAGTSQEIHEKLTQMAYERFCVSSTTRMSEREAKHLIDVVRAMIPPTAEVAAPPSRPPFSLGMLPKSVKPPAIDAPVVPTAPAGIQTAKPAVTVAAGVSPRTPEQRTVPVVAVPPPRTGPAPPGLMQPRTPEQTMTSPMGSPSPSPVRQALPIYMGKRK